MRQEAITIHRRVHNKLDKLAYRREIEQRNLILLIIDRYSQTGTGKSTLAIKFAQKHDPQFDIDHIFFETQDFIQALLDDRFPPGSYVVLDEVGVSLDSRRSISHTNVDFSQILQIFREKQISLICTLPTTTVLDLRAEELSDAMIMIDRRGRATVYEMVINHFEKKHTVYKRKWFKLKWTPLKGELWKEYLERKSTFINYKLTKIMNRTAKTPKLKRKTKVAEVNERLDKGEKPKQIHDETDIPLKYIHNISYHRSLTHRDAPIL